MISINLFEDILEINKYLDCGWVGWFILVETIL